MDTATLICTVIVGIGSGLMAALIGYFKSTPPEDFELPKFLPTIMIGGVVGGLMAYMNVPYEQAYQFAVSVGAVAVIENVAKVIVRNIRAWLASRKPAIPQ